jgi:hypothetical protein
LATSLVVTGMSYRDPAAALQTRRETLSARLDAARRAAAEARELGDLADGLATELAETDALLAAARAAEAKAGRLGRGLSERSLLDDVRIASPCRAAWDDMVGDERVRFCGQCEKNVYNVSALPREEAEALLRDSAAGETGGANVCIRLYRREDGTVLTADCPDGVRRKRVRLAVYGAVGGGMLWAGAAGALLSVRTVSQGGVRPVPVTPVVGARAPGGSEMMGEVAISPPTAEPDTTPVPPPPPRPLVPKRTVTGAPPSHAGTPWTMGGMVTGPTDRPSPVLMGKVEAK